jgi:MFS family permease
MVRVRRVGREMREHLPHLPPISTIPASIKNRIKNPQAEMRAREGLTAEAALNATYNFRRGVLNGIMFTLVDALIAPSLVLALFINRLGAPNALVGLLPALLAGGWFLPQILTAGRVQGMPLVMHWYRRAGILRVVAFVLLTAATFFLGDQPALLLSVFFVCFSFYAFMGGITGIPWLEMVGKSISPRRRGAFFGQRNFWGGVLALLASAPIGLILSEQFAGLSFPHNFALLFAITSVVIALGVYFWSSMREPVAIQTASPVSIGTLFKRGVQAFKENVDYRSFMFARVLLAIAAIADPFFVVFAEEKLGAPPATVGLYLGAVSISSLLSNFLWSPLADRASNRTLMSLTVVSVALVPLTATGLALLIGSVDNTFLYAAFTLVFIFSGLAVGASRIINNNMMLTIAPPADRATYIGFLNTILGIVIFVLVLGGVLVYLLGFEFVFVLAVVASALAMIYSWRMSTRAPEF